MDDPPERARLVQDIPTLWSARPELADRLVPWLEKLSALAESTVPKANSTQIVDSCTPAPVRKKRKLNLDDSVNAKKRLKQMKHDRMAKVIPRLIFPAQSHGRNINKLKIGKKQVQA